MVPTRVVWLSVALSVSTGPSATLRAQATPQSHEPRITTIATSEPLPSQGRLGGVAIDRSGNIYVSNFGASVWRVAPTGHVTTLLQSLRGTSGNVVDASGNLLQASFLEGRIVRIAPDGSVSDLVPSGLLGPVGLAIAHDGSVYVCQCQGNSIARVSADGKVTTLATSADFDCPNGITIGPDGAAYIVSFNNEYVVRVDPVGGRATRFATVPDGRNAHIAYARGSFWVTKIETNLLYRVDRAGHADQYAGNGSLGFEDGSARTSPLARPNGIAVMPDSDALVVNTLDGPWRGDAPTRLVLRAIELEPGNATTHIEIPVGDFVFDAIAGGPERGELVVLLHGFPQTGEAFAAQIEALAAAGYRAVAPDQRGYSPGARPAAVGEYVMGNFVSDVIGMVDALGHDRFHLVGHDWGGAVAWVVATRYPDRVRTLTILATPHFAALSAARSDSSTDQGARSSYFTEFAKPGAEYRLLANDKGLLRNILSGVPANKRNIYISKLGEPDALRAALAWYHVFGQSPTPSSSAPTITAPPVVSLIRVPTLYVWGDHDRAFGRAAAEKTSEFVSAPYRFEVLEGIGHWLPEVAPDVVNRLLLQHLRDPRANDAAARGP